MFCTKCGAPLDGGKFCTMCGEPAPAAAAPAADICKNCGNELKGSKFCVVCGTPVNAEPASAPVPEPVVEYIPEPVVAEEPEPVPTVVAEPAPEIEAEPEPTPEVIPDDNCAVCGAPMQGRAFCVMCGAKKGAEPAPVTYDVCKNCGADLNGKAFCIVCGTPKDAAKPAPTPAPAPADICTNCGAPLNGKSFCVVCGTSKSGAAPAPQPVQTTYVPPVQPAYTPAAALSPLKKAFGSGKFLVTAIFVTLYLLISIIAGTGDLGIPGMPVQLKATVSSGAISANIVPILIAVGLWITYATAKGSGKISSAGLSIIRVLMLLSLIGGWIGFVVVALAGLVFFVPGLIMAVTGESSAFGGFITTDYAPGAALALGIAILVAAGVMLLFVLLFYRRLHLFAKSAVESVKADKAEYKYASAVKGWLMFFGVVACIGAAILVIVGLAIPAGGIAMYGVASLCSAVATICGSSWIKSFCLEN